MSAGGFDTNNSSASYHRYGPRRSSGTFPAPNYNRSFNHPPRRRTPSPSSSRRFSYDSYTPERVDPPFRNEHSNTYRPNIYRPEYPAAGFWEPPPSPDSYSYSPRVQDVEVRDPSNSWHSPVKSQPSWQDRKPIPTSPVRDRPRRDDTMATRIFEPSDAWKRDHNDRPARLDGAPLSDRYPQHRRESIGGSPDRPQRVNRSFTPSPGGDRYRPQEPFHLRQASRPEYDSYRPPYEDSWTPPLVRESISAPMHRRGPSGSYQKRGQLDFRAGGPPLSPKINRFPARRNRGPTFSINQHRNISPSDQMNYGGDFFRADHGDRGDDDDDQTKSSPYSRASSRSSIASTVPSEKHDESSYSADPVGAEQSNVTQEARGITKSFPQSSRSPARRASPSPCPPGLQSLNDSKPMASTSRDTATCPMSSRDETRDDDITEEEEDEVTEILSQNRLKDFPRDQNRQSQSKDPLRSPSHITAKTTSRAPSEANLSIIRNSSSPIRQDSTIKASTEEQDAEMLPPPASPTASATLPDPPPPTTSLPTPPSDDHKDDGIFSAATDEVQVNSKTIREVQRASTGSTAARANVNIPVISFRSTGNANRLISIPSIRRTASKSTPVTPLSEPPASSSVTENGAESSIMDALRLVITTRLFCDRQTREDRVNPVLLANLSLAPQPDFQVNKENAEGVICDVLSRLQLPERVQGFNQLRPSLVEFFSQRQAFISDKVQTLRQEYAELQDQWNSHCHMLNEQAKPSILEGETMPIGRTTRRSANLGDVVRSDLEMDQILASLENNDATDPNHLSQRNLATIPEMICVTNGKVDYLFDDTSHRVNNPAEYYAPHTGIDDWTREEKDIFSAKYAAYPKQFDIIAEYLPNKTSSQCVDYYYLHKKGLIDFRKVVSRQGSKRRRRGAGKRKGNALLTDIRKHDEEVHRDSGSPSVAPSRGGGRPRKQKEKEKEGGKDKDKEKDKNRDKEGSEPKVDSEKKGAGRSTNKRTMTQMQETTPTETPTPEPEGKSRRRRAAAGSSTAPPSRTLSLNLEGNEEATPEPDHRPAKRAKRSRKVKSAAIVEDEPSTPEMDAKPLPDASVSAPPAAGKLPAKALDQDKSRWSSQSVVTPS